jgi:hypothetical protein
MVGKGDRREEKKWLEKIGKKCIRSRGSQRDVVYLDRPIAPSGDRKRDGKKWRKAGLESEGRREEGGIWEGSEAEQTRKMERWIGEEEGVNEKREIGMREEREMEKEREIGEGKEDGRR